MLTTALVTPENIGQTHSSSFVGPPLASRFPTLSTCTRDRNEQHEWDDGFDAPLENVKTLFPSRVVESSFEFITPSSQLSGASGGDDEMEKFSKPSDGDAFPAPIKPEMNFFASSLKPLHSFVPETTPLPYLRVSPPLLLSPASTTSKPPREDKEEAKKEKENVQIKQEEEKEEQQKQQQQGEHHDDLQNKHNKSKQNKKIKNKSIQFDALPHKIANMVDSQLIKLVKREAKLYGSVTRVYKPNATTLIVEFRLKSAASDFLNKKSLKVCGTKLEMKRADTSLLHSFLSFSSSSSSSSVISTSSPPQTPTSTAQCILSDQDSTHTRSGSGLDFNYDTNLSSSLSLSSLVSSASSTSDSSSSETPPRFLVRPLSPITIFPSELQTTSSSSSLKFQLHGQPQPQPQLVPDSFHTLDSSNSLPFHSERIQSEKRDPKSLISLLPSSASSLSTLLLTPSTISTPTKTTLDSSPLCKNPSTLFKVEKTSLVSILESSSLEPNTTSPIGPTSRRIQQQQQHSFTINLKGKTNPHRQQQQDGQLNITGRDENTHILVSPQTTKKLLRQARMRVLSEGLNKKGDQTDDERKKEDDKHKKKDDKQDEDDETQHKNKDKDTTERKHNQHNVEPKEEIKDVILIETTQVMSLFLLRLIPLFFFFFLYFLYLLFFFYLFFCFFCFCFFV